MNDNTTQGLSGSADISILLPVYEAEDTIASCLRSIERQTYKRWKCFIVNDGSNDKGLEIAEEFALRDSRFHIINREHRGIVFALNEGLNQIDTEFTARMDADDVMHRHRLAEQVAYLRSHPGTAAVGCQVRIFPRNGLGPGLREYESWLNNRLDYKSIYTDAFVECPIAHPTLCIRTDELRRFGYRHTSWAEDYDLILRLLVAKKKIESIPKRLLVWRNGPKRLSKTDSRCSIDQFLACKATYLCEDFLKTHKDYILWGYGKTGRKLAKELQKLGRSPKYIVDIHTGRIGNKIMGVPVVAPNEIGDLPNIPLIVSVAREIPRNEARKILDSFARKELVDYICTA